jgi:hypothetical protein
LRVQDLDDYMNLINDEVSSCDVGNLGRFVSTLHFTYAGTMGVTSILFQEGDSKFAYKLTFKTFNTDHHTEFGI